MDETKPQDEPIDVTPEAQTVEPEAPAEQEPVVKPAEPEPAAQATEEAPAGGPAAKKGFSLSSIDPRFCVKQLDRILDWSRKTFTPDLFDTLSGWGSRYGHVGLLAAQILTGIFFIVAAINVSSWGLLLKGAALIGLLIILQYTADKFLHAGKSLVEASPSRISSGAMLDCLALLAEVAGILLFLAYVIMAGQMHQWGFIWVGLGLWALCDAIAFIALHPQLANATPAEDVSAGEEAIGIMSFLVKAFVQTVPAIFGIGTILGAAGILTSIVSHLRTGSFAAADSSIGLVVLCACLPFASYVFFLVYHLLIDILRAILAIPRKLDELKKD